MCRCNSRMGIRVSALRRGSSGNVPEGSEAMKSYYWKLPERVITEPIEIVHGKINGWHIRHVVKNGEILFARKADRDLAIEKLKEEG